MAEGNAVLMAIEELRKKGQDSAVARAAKELGLACSKPLGYRAGREPDASWHRPSYHKPGLYYKYESPGEHIYNPDVECREDIGPLEQPGKPKWNPNNSRIINGQKCWLFPDGTWRNSKGQKCR